MANGGASKRATRLSSRNMPSKQSAAREESSAGVEQWLDQHPAFVRSYFMRRAGRQLVDDWLAAHGFRQLDGGGTCSSSSTSTSTVAPDQHQAARTTSAEPVPQPTSTGTTNGSSAPNNKLTFPAPAFSTSARKISATDFESRSGTGYLRPMLSTTPDGRPTFVTPRPSPDLTVHHHHQPPDLLAGVKNPEEEVESAGQRRAADSARTGDECEAAVERRLLIELVKDIYDQLDLQTLLHKILKNIATLINGDKSSLFLVRGEPGSPERRLVSQLFNVDQDSSAPPCAAKGDAAENYSIPWGVGLVGYVAQSGQSVNIANCYEDPRFSSSIDQRTGYRTKHMLCAPILDKNNDIVGVAQVINKRDGSRFSKADEIKFERYLQFCGIGLRNAQSYENCQLENQRNQVILDLARMVFEEQSSIEKVMYRIMVHIQSLLECQRCQVLLVDADVTHTHPEQPLAEPNPNEPTTTTMTTRSANTSPSGATTTTTTSSAASATRQTNQPTGKLAPPNGSNGAKLFSQVFELEEERFFASQLKNGGTCQFPINALITNYVATTGDTLIIDNAHKSSLFDCSLDNNSHFRHQSILCMPIRNGQRRIIGVSQLVNKRNGCPFNRNDADLLEAFAIFCGLGIHNTLMYENLLKIMAKQRVTFEVLSYHATAPLDEAKKLHRERVPDSAALNLMDLRFDDFSLAEQPMLKSCLRFFHDLNLVNRFHIDKLVLCNWILSVQKNYRRMTYHPCVGGNGLKPAPVGYHNWRHAFNVTQMMFAILMRNRIRQAFSDLERLALIIACLCHDLDHRGTNNSFQIKSASPLAKLYSTSTMEHHHFDQCIMILNSQGNQILANLSPKEYSTVITLLEQAILATDLANHFQKRDRFFALVRDNKLDWHNEIEHRSLLQCMLMTACDVAAITKPWHIQKRVADLVTSEFYHQGDIEKQELKIEPVDIMNRDKMSKLPEMQIGFIDSICEPMYRALARLFPIELSKLLDGCLTNRDKWRELAESQKKSVIPNFRMRGGPFKKMLAPIETNTLLADTIKGN